MRACTRLLCLPIAAGWTAAASAQTFPSRPVTLIVPYVAGGGTDLVARLAAQALWGELGQSFVVDNHGGGGGMIGVEGAARAPRRWLHIAVLQHRAGHH
jgi:tripartite-type tricarboxylate transporter receptor subunit TctC